ncbi:MAG: hypothetical protein JEY97_02585 [Bacteroidales bacterium]|nr:hypothetical protein [Bacteroidales bacterium]
MKKKFIIFALLILLFSIYSCETDVDIIADYEEITVVYGLLSIDDQTTYLRINKAFLGEGNALLMAKVPDSSNFLHQLDVTIEEMDGNIVKEVYDFTIDTIYNKDTGMFYNEYQILYKSDINLNDDYKYRLKIVNNDSIISAETEIVHDFSISKPSSGSNYVKFIPDLNSTLKWVSAKNGKRYEGKIIFNFKEKEYNSPNPIIRSITWSLGSLKSTNTDGGTDMEFTISNNYFYELLKYNVPYSDVQKEENVEYRIADSVDFILTAGGEELNTFLEVNEPSYSIVQDKPEYTNVANGIGIFSSRKNEIRRKLIHPETKEEIVKLNIKFLTNPPTK